MATPRSEAPRRSAASSKQSTPKQIGPARSPFAGMDPRVQSLLFVGAILLLLVLFFSKQIFGDMLFGASDFVSWESFRPYLDAQDAKGEPPLWIPYIFSGMPAFASFLVTGDRWWDLTMKLFYSSEHIIGFINYPVTRVVFHYFLYGLGMYLLMRTKKATRGVALFVALAAIFSTWIIIYIMIGHNTKILVLMTFPYIFLCLEKLIHRWSLLYAGLLILAIHILWEASHLQTAFYGACAVGIYLLVELIGALRQKNPAAQKTGTTANVGLAIATLVVAGAFAYGMGLDRNLAVQEYLPYSTRGAASITADPTHKEGAMEVGQGWEYSTNWSFSPQEMVTFFSPSYYGFGKMELPRDVVASFNPQLLQQNGIDPEGHMATYWGQMSFTDAAHYMGAVVLALGLWGFWINRRNRFAQALLAIGVFGLILSFGRNFDLLYKLFYDLVPGFNKFRAPSQSLVLLEFVFPILAGLGLKELIARREAGDATVAKGMIGWIAGFGGLTLLILLILSSGSSYNEAVAQSGKLLSASAEAASYMHSRAMTDLFLTLLFGAGGLGLAYFYAKGRISSVVMVGALIAISTVDLWRVAFIPMEGTPAKEVMAQFDPTDVDEFLKKDTEKYRILNLATQPNFPARHFQEHILGYSSAKMRSYQNLLDVAGNGDVPTSPLAWDLLNTKYLIMPNEQAKAAEQQGMTPAFRSQRGVTVMQNNSAMPRAWFVNRVEVANEKAILEMIKSNGFDPRDVAYLVAPLKEQVEPVGYAAGMQDKMKLDSTGNLVPDTTGSTASAAAKGSVQITKYEPHHIAMDVEAPGKNFLVISEIHYPPGWRATIDGKEAEIIQTDYLLRGLVVPAGKHKIEMNYVSGGFQTGKYASLGLNVVMFGMIAAGALMGRKKEEQA
ncbi:MAG: YfhO family protein [Candidatus Kapabacteria bacterium]|nr:YfhO family protein [Candidatus Kapabacteria bacterium]